MQQKTFRKREKEAEWFGKPLCDPHPAYFERAIYTTDTPEYKLMASLRARSGREKKRPGDRRTLFIDPQILISFAAFVSAVGRSPSPLHKARLIERKKGWIKGNVRWEIPTENERLPTFEDMTGKVIGQFTIMGPYKRTPHGSRWWAICSCGRESWVWISTIRARENPKCKSCAAKERTEDFKMRGLRANGKPFAEKKQKVIKEKVKCALGFERKRWYQVKQCFKSSQAAKKTHTHFDINIVNDFDIFMQAVGPRPENGKYIRLFNKADGYIAGNMYWSDKK